MIHRAGSSITSCWAAFAMLVLLSLATAACDEPGLSSEDLVRAEVSYQRAMTLYADGNHRLGLVELQRAAAYDHPAAQYAIGVIVERGDETLEQSFGAALEWYEKSAQHGYAYAQRNLARLYEDGLGVERNVKLVRHWYALAAAQNDREAKEALIRFAGE